MAFPPIVPAATRPLSIIENTAASINSTLPPICETIKAADVPLMIPHISPITSLNTLDTRPAFFISISELFAPFIFEDAIELNGFSSATVTATPSISNTIPMAIINAITVVDALRSMSENMLINTDRKNAKNVMHTTHFRRALSASLSFPFFT